MWRTPRLVRAAAVAVGILFTGLAWSEHASASATASTPDWFLVVLLVAGYLFCLVVAFRPRAVLQQHKLQVTNFVRKHEIPVAEIQDVQPTFEGLVVTRRDGRRITAVAVQRPNLWLFLERPSRSDDVAREILRMANAGRGTT